MSRLIIPSVVDGDPVNAAELNQRFNAFDLPGQLDDFNVRGFSIDLPQFTSSKFMAPKLEIGALGYNDWKHGAFNTEKGQVTGDPAHIVSDSGGTPTVLPLGAGWALSTADILRVYWDLSVLPGWDSARAWDAAGLDLVSVFKEIHPSVGTIHVSNGLGCWLFWLQWDITSAALTNWVEVAGQGDFNTAVPGTGGRGGELLTSCQATSVVPCVLETAQAPAGGRFNSRYTPSSTVQPYGGIGWTTVDGAWHYAAPAPVTVYGLRVAFSGPFGAHHNGVNNYLIRSDSTAADAELSYNGGSIQALLMRKA